MCSHQSHEIAQQSSHPVIENSPLKYACPPGEKNIGRVRSGVGVLGVLGRYIRVHVEWDPFYCKRVFSGSKTFEKRFDTVATPGLFAERMTFLFWAVPFPFVKVPSIKKQSVVPPADRTK